MFRVLPVIWVRLLVKERSTKTVLLPRSRMPNSATPAFARRGAVFAAGHLGELTWQIPVELVDAVLAETRTAERRLRWRVGVYVVLGWCLFPGLGYRKVWAKLTAAPRGRKTPSFIF